MNIQPHEDEVFYDAFGMRIWEKRHSKTTDLLEQYNIKRVCDMGCNDGKFIRRLTRDERYDLITGVDIDPEALSGAERNSIPEGYHSVINPEKENPLKVLLYQADILKDCSFLAQLELEAITLIEVIEHIEISNLGFLEENIFGVISPKVVIVTTPNYEFNRFFDDIENPPFRHDDHKFEMTREEFMNWANTAAKRYGYFVSFDGVGLPKTNDESRGFCSQFAIFEKRENFIFDDSSLRVFLLPQQVKNTAEIVYPSRKIRTIDEKFCTEFNYAYYFLLTYPENDDGMEDDVSYHDGSFLKIIDLLKIKGLNEIVKGCPEKFLELLKKNMKTDEYELSHDEKRIKLVEDTNEHNSFEDLENL